MDIGASRASRRLVTVQRLGETPDDIIAAMTPTVLVRRWIALRNATAYPDKLSLRRPT
jgi:hypothetical protein